MEKITLTLDELSATLTHQMGWEPIDIGAFLDALKNVQANPANCAGTFMPVLKEYRECVADGDTAEDEPHTLAILEAAAAKYQIGTNPIGTNSK